MQSLEGSHALPELLDYGIPCRERLYSGTLICRQVEIDRGANKPYERRARIVARAGPSGGNEGQYYIYEYPERPIGASNSLFTTPDIPTGATEQFWMQKEVSTGLCLEKFIYMLEE